jgi:uncharacterized membrane protein YgcG
MSVTAEELVVAIRSENVGETVEDLENVERSMDDTAESAGDSAEQLEGFSERFAGAMSAAVAALAVGAAGLLSQVPVLGEAFGGLAALVSAIAFQMDGVLRPVLTPITNQFYEWANAIFEADGVLGDIIGVLATVASILAIVGVAAVKLGVTWGAVTAAAGTVASVLATVAGVVGTVIGAIVSLPAAIAVAIAAIVAFAAAYLTNWRGTRDKTNKIIGEIIDFVVSGFKKFGTMALKALGGFVDQGVRAFNEFAAAVSEWAAGLAEDAFEWGKNLIENFIRGIRAIIGRLRGFLSDLGEIGASVGIDIPDLGSLGGGGGGGGGGSGRLPFRGGGTGTGGAQIDGRQLTESTGRYRSDPGRRRGL